jgi:hypothetical protein
VKDIESAGLSAPQLFEAGDPHVTCRLSVAPRGLLHIHLFWGQDDEPLPAPHRRNGLRVTNYWDKSQTLDNLRTPQPAEFRRGRDQFGQHLPSGLRIPITSVAASSEYGVDEEDFSTFRSAGATDMLQKG